MVKVAENCK